jgi:hypothetical protein
MKLFFLPALTTGNVKSILWFFNTIQTQEIFVRGSGELHFPPSSVLILLELMFLERPIFQTGERVPPSDLESYSVSHEFSAPSCLCIRPTAIY